MGLYRLPVLALCVAVLAGCAAQSAYREGRTLMQEGRPLEGIGKLEEAAKLEPRSADYRAAYLQARESHGLVLLEQADKAASEGRYDEAEGKYKELLLVRTQQDRAVMGLRQLEQRRRWDEAIVDAQKAMANKDLAGAQARLKPVLLENAAHPGALALQKRIDQLQTRPAVPTTLSNGYKQPITIEFKDVPLRTVFEVISRSSKLNFLFDKDVKTDQKTSIYLRNSTVEAAVNWLLLTNQLAQRVLDGSSILIYPATDAKLKEYQPLLVKSFYLANAEAKSVAATLKTLLKSKDVVVDDKLNLVIMRDSPDAIRLAEKLVAVHDVPEAEVMLEVEILEIKRGRLMDLGVKWPDQVSLSLLSSDEGKLALSDLHNKYRRSDIGVTVGSATIAAKAQNSDANILANPRIRARNHEKAKILIGQKVPNITSTSTATGFIAESVNYVDVGLKLEVEPAIYLDNEVAIKIALEVSNIVSQQETKAGSKAYELGTRTAQTVLRLKDGENQVLAGLISDEDRRSASKVPLLGEIPLLGRLFGEQSDDATKTEIVLSITPRVLRNVRPPDARVMEFDSGTESNLRSWTGGAAGEPVSATPDAAFTSPGAAMNTPSGATPSQSPGTMATAGANTAGSGQTSPGATGTVGGLAGAPAGSANLMKWEGPAAVSPGDTFTVQLSMQSEQPLINLPLVLGYDPKVVQVLSVNEGGLLKDGSSPTTFSQMVDAATGQIVTTNARGEKTRGAVAPGVALTLSLRIQPDASATETSFRMLSAQPTSVSGLSFAMPQPAPLVLPIKR